MSVALRPESTSPCPSCGRRCYVGVRAPQVLILNCPDHGVFTIGGGDRDDVGAGTMHPEERLWLIDQAIRRFRVDPENEDFLVMQSSSLQCNYVQFRYNHGELWGEVCSREWDCKYCGDRPLPPAAQVAIADLGFMDGGDFQNYEARHLSGPTAQLALLMDNAMIRAFDEDYDTS